jgi:TolB-like protein
METRVGTEAGVDLRFAQFEIDLKRHEVRRSGEPVAVEPQVFDVLVHLVRHRDRIVSKDELIEAVWHGRAISEGALSSRISAARRAIGDTGEAQNLIRTLHKRGFRFVGDVTADAPPTVPSEGARPAASREGPDRPAPVVPAPLLALPDRPSIAVLPFDNMSDDGEQEYFADGLTEDIITALSRLSWCFVIARNSSFAYKDQSPDVRRVAAELGVRYVLEGSVRKAGGRVRVTGQLIDGTTGTHLWADKYDRELSDVFAIQDDITNRVVGSVGAEILMAEASRVKRKPPQSLDAWDFVIQALPNIWRMSTADQLRAQELLQHAIDRDPDYAHAHALLGWSNLIMFNLDSGAPIGTFTERASAAGARALALDDQEPWANLVVGLAHARRRRPELAIAHLTRAISLEPNFALGRAGLGYALAVGGQPERGLESVEQAERLSPRDPCMALYAPTVRYMALFALARYEEAIAVCRMTAELYPRHSGAWRLMTVSLGLLGRIEEAKAAMARTRELQPDLSRAHVENDCVFVKEDDRLRFLLGLQKAGLPD